MGLAPYGDPAKYYDKLNSVFKRTSNKFWIDQKYFTWEYSEKVMFNRRLCRLLDLTPRLPEEPITQDHMDLAAALQKVYEFLKNIFINEYKNISQNIKAVPKKKVKHKK